MQKINGQDRTPRKRRCDQWLKWFCEAGRGAHLTKPGWSKPHTHSNPTNLALFGHKITLYRFNQGLILLQGAQMGARGLSPLLPYCDGLRSPKRGYHGYYRLSCFVLSVVDMCNEGVSTAYAQRCVSDVQCDYTSGPREFRPAYIQDLATEP